MKKIFKKYKPVLYLLAALAILIFFSADLFPTGDLPAWITNTFRFFAFIFSLLSVKYGMKYLRNKQRRGLLFVYDMLSVITGTIILIALSLNFIFYLLSLYE